MKLEVRGKITCLPSGSIHDKTLPSSALKQKSYSNVVVLFSFLFFCMYFVSFASVVKLTFHGFVLHNHRTYLMPPLTMLCLSFNGGYIFPIINATLVIAFYKLLHLTIFNM